MSSIIKIYIESSFLYLISFQKTLYAYVKSIDEDAEEHLVESKDEAEMDSSDEDEEQVEEEENVQEPDVWNSAVDEPLPVLNLDDSTTDGI